jgi:hypothetical protein
MHAMAPGRDEHAAHAPVENLIAIIPKTLPRSQWQKTYVQYLCLSNTGHMLLHFHNAGMRAAVLFADLEQLIRSAALQE